MRCDILRQLQEGWRLYRLCGGGGEFFRREVVFGHGLLIWSLYGRRRGKCDLGNEVWLLVRKRRDVHAVDARG